ncbi:MAG: hypothetical protein Q4G36_07545 [Paracoccus sp. (in: a-proteobacteria)]|nr:hypothetical protein [Paracoccus sp. (in: a-proteobacteria)]
MRLTTILKFINGSPGAAALITNNVVTLQSSKEHIWYFRLRDTALRNFWTMLTDNVAQTST